MMIESVYPISMLFEQLGMSGNSEDIDAFIAQHALEDGVLLAEASFWTPAQARFLREGLTQDSNWAEVIDELNLRLHT